MEGFTPHPKHMALSWRWLRQSMLSIVFSVCGIVLVQVRVRVPSAVMRVMETQGMAPPPPHLPALLQPDHSAFAHASRCGCMPVGVGRCDSCSSASDLQWDCRVEHDNVFAMGLSCRTHGCWVCLDIARVWSRLSSVAVRGCV